MIMSTPEPANSGLPSPGPDRLPPLMTVAALGVTGIPLGVLWDISWHSTIGRDTFWTPAHILIHIGGLIPGLISLWLLLKATFREGLERDSSVMILGLRGPLGAWVVCWGSLAMLTSAPFDNWWHDAYGLDVKILSPPHMVLALGIFGVCLGVVLQLLSWQNRLARGRGQEWAATLFLYCGGVLLTMLAIMLTEQTYPNLQHSSRFYVVGCTTFPTYLVLLARASTRRWAATSVAAVYTAFYLSAAWGLPLFKAHPKLAPIYLAVDHMVPPAFPLLLLAPALVIDLILQARNQRGKARAGFWADTVLAACLGLGYAAAFIPIQWYGSEFLLSSGARNAFFVGSRYFPYFARPGPFMDEFWFRNTPKLTAGALVIAISLAVVKARIGLAIGSWMTRVRR